MAVARPRGGSALVLGPTAALIWTALGQWTQVDELAELLLSAYPGVPEQDRLETIEQVVSLLDSEGLLERSTP